MTGTCWHEPIFIYLPHLIFVSLVCFDQLYPGCWFWWFGLVVWSAGIHLWKGFNYNISPAGSSYGILVRFSHFSQWNSGFHQASTDWLIRLDPLYKWLAAIGESRKYTDFMNVTWLLSVLHKFIIESWKLISMVDIDIDIPPDIFKYGLHLIFFLECPECRILTTFSGGFRGSIPPDLETPRKSFNSASLAAFAPPPPQDMNTSFPGRFNQTACRFQTASWFIWWWDSLGWKNKVTQNFIREENMVKFHQIGKCIWKLLGFPLLIFLICWRVNALVFSAVVWRSFVAGEGSPKTCSPTILQIPDWIIKSLVQVSEEFRHTLPTNNVMTTLNRMRLWCTKYTTWQTLKYHAVTVLIYS